MNDTTASLASVSDEEKLVTPNSIMWTLLILGVFMVCFANPLGRLWVTDNYAGGGGWSPDKARDAALTIRCLGCMSFAAGLVQQIVIQIKGHVTK
jgi:hypothetical protein